MNDGSWHAYVVIGESCAHWTGPTRKIIEMSQKALEWVTGYSHWWRNSEGGNHGREQEKGKSSMEITMPRYFFTSSSIRFSLEGNSSCPITWLGRRHPSHNFFIYSNMSLFHYSFAYYFFFTEPRGLHSSSWTGCSITFKGYCGLLKLYPLLQS